MNKNSYLLFVVIGRVQLVLIPLELRLVLDLEIIIIILINQTLQIVQVNNLNLFQRRMYFIDRRVLTKEKELNR